MIIILGHNPDYKSIAEHCNLWRNYDDISDSWDSVLGIINYYGEDKDGFGQFAGPGHWNDPDMLIIGNYGLSLDQSWAQMGMWSMLASPLIMSADLRTIRQHVTKKAQTWDNVSQFCFHNLYFGYVKAPELHLSNCSQHCSTSTLFCSF